TGQTNARAAIQQAIDDAGNAGGGTVYLPSGVYALRAPAQGECVLCFRESGVRLVGAGVDKTFLRLESYEMRDKSMILVAGDGDWKGASDRVAPSFQFVPSKGWRGGTQPITAELTYPTQIIPVEDPSRLNVGDWVVLTHETTEDW